MCAAAIAAFDALPTGRPGPREWAMLAAVVAVDTDDGAGARVPRVLSLATGSKCVGARDMRPDGCVLNDSHAEVLARRAFKLYVLREIAAHRTRCCSEAGGAPSTPATARCGFGILRHDERTQPGSFTLRRGVSLHMYISDSPCGDASVYDDGAGAAAGAAVGHIVESCAEDGDGAAAGGARSPAPQGFRRTGAPLAPGTDGGVADAAAHAAPRAAQLQQLGALRTKPGRSDLPPSKRSPCMSCSDKAARWCCGAAGGLSGTLLAHELGTPLTLATVVISGGEAAAVAAASARGAATVAPPGAPPLGMPSDGVAGGRGDAGAATAAAPPPQLVALRRALVDRAAVARRHARSAWRAAVGEPAEPQPSSPPSAGDVAQRALPAAHGDGGDAAPAVVALVPRQFRCGRAARAAAAAPHAASSAAATQATAGSGGGRQGKRARDGAPLQPAAGAASAAGKATAPATSASASAASTPTHTHDADGTVAAAAPAAPSFAAVNAVADPLGVFASGAAPFARGGAPPGDDAARRGVAPFPSSRTPAPALSVEVTVAATGVRQGATARDVAAGTAASRLSKRELLAAFLDVHVRARAGGAADSGSGGHGCAGAPEVACDAAADAAGERCGPACAAATYHALKHGTCKCHRGGEDGGASCAARVRALRAGRAAFHAAGGGFERWRGGGGGGGHLEEFVAGISRL